MSKKPETLFSNQLIKNLNEIKKNYSSVEINNIDDLRYHTSVIEIENTDRLIIQDF